MGMYDKLLPQQQDLSWRWIFFANVFFGCIAFSIVMPNLWLYLESMKATKAFYAFVVASFSCGEAIGAIAIGALSNHLGTKRSLVLCSCLGITGASSYALAYNIFEAAPHLGPIVVLAGRLLQGIGAGGRQAVEQAYFSVAAPPEKLTELTSTLSTFACLGFIFGPMFGAAAGLIPPFQLGPVVFDNFTLGGWLCASLDVGIILNLTFRFTEVTQQPGSHAGDGAATDNAGSQPGGGGGGAAAVSFAGVWACIAFFFVHFNGFALQETITTPLVQEWFGWSEMKANLLFTAAGVANFLCSGLLAWLSAPVPTPSGEPGAQRVSDRQLLAASLVLAAVGWLMMVPVGGPMGIAQFLVAFTLVTVAFPFGRGVCLASAGKLLGDRPQGAWMGVMFALGSIARIVGPFWAVQGFQLGAVVVFGATAALFVLSLAAVRLLWSALDPGSGGAWSSGTPLRRHSKSYCTSPSSLRPALQSPGASPMHPI